MTSPTYRMDPIDPPTTLNGDEHHQMVSYHDMTAQPRPDIQCPQPMPLTFPYSHFALMYIDHRGKLQLETSNSIAGRESAIFTEEVQERFLKLVSGDWQHNSPRVYPGSLSLSNASPLQSSWYHTSQARPVGLIPCEWQSLQNRRHKRNPRRVDSAIAQAWQLSSPSPSAKRSALRVGQTSHLRSYYEKAFECFQQLNCRVIAKAFVKLVEPRKQVNHPYNGRKTIAGSTQRLDPELTKPKWWPVGVTHREPDHLPKPERIRLLVHILCELKDSHGITAEKLKDAGQDVRRQIAPAARLEVLDEIYYVRAMEELYLDGKISGDTVVYVSHVQMDETVDDAAREHRDPLAPLVTVQGDESRHPDTRHQASDCDQQRMDRSYRDLPISSDESCAQSVKSQHPAKRAATHDYYLPLSPASSPSASRSSSLDRAGPTYSSDIDPAMLSSGDGSRSLAAPKGVHFGGATSIPNYFANQFATHCTGQNTHSGPWDAISDVHPQLAFPGY